MWDYDYWKTKLYKWELIQGYQNWVKDYIDQGWKRYEISFMFHQLPGSQSSMLGQMRREIERVYSRLATRFHRDPRSRQGFQFLPRMILFPDFPVFKHQKKSIQDVSLNNGLHYGGIALTPPISRFQLTLDAHFAQDQENYVNEKLARIHVVPITRDPGYVTDYVAKSFKRGRVTDDDIIILPKVISELPAKKNIRISVYT
jgi:hypothetical protein